MAKAKKLTQQEKASVAMRRHSREEELQELRDGVKHRSNILSKSRAELNKLACRNKGRRYK
jgi:hypothetical protein